MHAKIEGTYEYTLLLYIPSRAPFDLWVTESRRGVKLHVRRVFIMEDTGQLMPMYLRFVRGVIDSSDLPLNISRELLQGSRVVDHIRTTATKRVLRLLRDLAADRPEKYASFWKEFGAVLKEGVADDYANRDEIAGLLRFTSTRSATSEADVSLADYAGRMKEGQEKIYYLLAPTLGAAASSPHLEAYRDKDIEVLLLGQAVDNWVVTSLTEFEGHRLQSVAQGAPDFGTLDGEAEKQAQEQASTEYADLLAQLKEILAGKVWDVRVTSRLTTSPACIVADEPEIDINLVRRMRGTGLPSKPVLEINPEHALIRRLHRRAGRPAAGRLGPRALQPGGADAGGPDRGSQRVRDPAQRPAGHAGRGGVAPGPRRRPARPGRTWSAGRRPGPRGRSPGRSRTGRRRRTASPGRAATSR